MHDELKLHLNKLQTRATLSAIAILLAVLSIGFGLVLVSLPSLGAVVSFSITVICIIYLICVSYIAKKEVKQTPVILESDEIFSFKEIVTVFNNLADAENRLSTSEDVLFFRLNRIFKLRAILYRTADFNKKDFRRAKDCINKKANKALSISPWVNRFDATNMMRFNIIYTDTFNDALHQLLSRNANQNISRVEGIINIAIIGKQIIIPPIYGNCDLAEISRYKKTIAFLYQYLINR